MDTIQRESRPLQSLVAWGGAAALMLVPVLPERFAGKVAWDPGDFVFLALLVVGAGSAYELATRVPGRLAYRAGVAVAAIAGLFQAWINLAVGTIGSEDNPVNAIYFAVIGVALLGAVLAWFRPRGMAWAMGAAAIAQVLAFAVALTAGFGFTGPITVFFVALWLVSAWLFRKAA